MNVNRLLYTITLGVFLFGTPSPTGTDFANDLKKTKIVYQSTPIPDIEPITAPTPAISEFQKFRESVTIGSKNDVTGIAVYGKNHRPKFMSIVVQEKQTNVVDKNDITQFKKLENTPGYKLFLGAERLTEVGNNFLTIEIGDDIVIVLENGDVARYEIYKSILGKVDIQNDANSPINLYGIGHMTAEEAAKYLYLSDDTATEDKFTSEIMLQTCPEAGMRLFILGELVK